MIGYLKLGGAVVVLGLLTWLGFIVNDWHNDAQQLPVIVAELDQARADTAKVREDFAKVQEASRDYQTEIQTLRDTARERLPVVRLCRNMPADPQPGPVPAAERGPAAGAAAAGVVPQGDEADRDIAPELFALADRADELSAQVRGLKAYAQGCAGRPISGAEPG